MKNEIERTGIILKQNHGLDIGKYSDDFLKKVLEKRMAQSNEPSFDTYSKRLIDDRLEAACFFNSLQITYSEFFRNPLTFSCLEQIMLPSLIEKKKKEKQKEIRIWAAACASGQEAYSIAMLCDELNKNGNHDIRFRIFASDINPDEINAAIKGSYTKNSLGNVSFRRLQNYFNQDGDRYVIDSQLKEYIDFSEFDLLSELSYCPPSSIFGNFDIIFCINLLFYYKPEFQKKILHKISNCLASGAYLVVSEPEGNMAAQHGFREALINPAIFQKKDQIKTT